MTTSKAYLTPFFLILFLSFSNILKAQHTYTIYGSILYESIDADDYKSSFNSQSFLPIGNDLYEVTEVERRRTSTYIFERNPGFQLGTDLFFGNKKGLGFSTGIRLHYRDFSIETQTSITQFPLEVIDTIVIVPSNPVGGTQNCDRTVSIGNPNLQPSNSIRYQHLNLQIPFLLNYHIANGLIRFEGGGFISTPIFTRVGTTQFVFRQEREGNEFVCYTGVERQHDTSGDGTSNLTVGLQAGINYSILPKLQLNVGIQHTMNSIFSAENNNPFGFLSSEVPLSKVAPTAVYLSVAYVFKQKSV